jgi:hypothetical protein
VSYNLLSLKHPKARKDHRCIWCGGAIPKGSTYASERSVFDGEMQNHHWHEECYTYAPIAMGECIFEFTPYDNENPKDAAHS